MYDTSNADTSDTIKGITNSLAHHGQGREEGIPDYQPQDPLGLE